jgi:cell division protein FtsW
MFKLFLTNKSGHRPNYTLFAAFFILIVFGLIALASASSDLGKIRFDDAYYYLKRQLLFGVGVGLIAFLFGFRLYYKNWKRWALVLLLLNISALLLVLVSPLGRAYGGSARWLALGPLSFQPSELLKVIFVIYLAAWLAGKTKHRTHDFMRGFVPFLVISGIVGALLLAEPATSTVFILLLTALIMYFLSGARFAYIGLTAMLAIVAVGTLVYITPYRLERFTSFLSPENDPQGSGYHLTQALISLGAGGINGVGFGESTNKYLYLPESIGDSIFVIIGEELGFIGASILITAFFVVLLKGFLIARNVRDEFGRLLMIGFASVIGIQMFVNVGALSGLIPLTGVTLPFISYGSSSLVAFMAMAGIMINISKYT